MEWLLSDLLIMSLSEDHQPSIQSIIKELYKQICPGTSPVVGAQVVKRCITILHNEGSFLDNSLPELDEFSVAQKIMEHLRIASHETAALEFNALHRKLIQVSSTRLQNRASILQFFFLMKDSQSEHQHSAKSNVDVGRSSSLRSLNSSSVGGDSPTRTAGRTRAGCDQSSKMHVSPSLMLPNADSFASGLPKENSYSINVNTERRRSQRRERPATVSRSSPPRTSSTGTYDVTEIQILQELIFCFQGVEGKVLKLGLDNGFKIDPKANVPQPQLVRMLMELGYLHNLVRGYCKEMEEGGAVARGLATAIRTQLTEYYCRVAQLDSDLKQCVSLAAVDSPMSEETLSHAGTMLTLRRLLVWVREPLLQFQLLADMCRVCVTEHGGAIISAAYTFSYHGDPLVQTTATKILTAATRPLFTLMCHWIIHGELYDPHDEFFVAFNRLCPWQNRWKDQYFLRKELVPAVMSEKQAVMVLNTGNCINFLIDVCKQKVAVTGARAKLRLLENAQGGELLQLAEPASPLAIIIESAFMEASQLVLDTLKSQFQLFEHFQGLRRYMLMGQGDFYQYLMQLLQPELDKNVELVYQHNLISIMETAIRATNAQFDDKEILGRVSVTTLECSAGEQGWDVFNVVYNTSGPLDTVFQLSDGSYKSMFRFLWQLKRVEYCLSNFRKEQTCMMKKLHRRTDFSELQALLNRTSLMTAEMVHYINQVQYYILFEVIECAFENFAKKFTAAKTIEEVIRDHGLFLEEIKTKTLRDNSSQSEALSSLMGALNISILNLISFGSQFLVVALQELNRRTKLEQLVSERGTCAKEELEHEKRVKLFSQRTTSAAKEIDCINSGYKEKYLKIKPFLQRIRWVI